MTDRKTRLNHSLRSILWVLLDILLCNLAMILAQQFRFEVQIPEVFFQRYVNLAPVMTLLCLLSFWAFGLYRNMLPYVKQLNTGLPYIASNGAELVGPDHTVLESVTFSPQQARDIIRYLKAQSFYTQCYRDESFYFEEECKASANYRRSSGMFGHGLQ